MRESALEKIVNIEKNRKNYKECSVFSRVPFVSDYFDHIEKKLKICVTQLKEKIRNEIC